LNYIGPPYIKSNAARKTRLINFDSSYAANGYSLKQQHRQELDKLAAFVSQTTDFSYWLVGYASKKGNHSSNQTLSANRALAVETYLKSLNPLFGDPDRLAIFEARGDQGYIAGASLSVSGLGMVGRIIQNMITGVAGSAPDFTDVTPPNPVTWEEVEGCLVSVSSASAGLLKGGGAAIITLFVLVAPLPISRPLALGGLVPLMIFSLCLL